MNIKNRSLEPKTLTKLETQHGTAAEGFIMTRLPVHAAVGVWYGRPDTDQFKKLIKVMLQARAE